MAGEKETGGDGVLLSWRGFSLFKAAVIEDLANGRRIVQIAFGRADVHGSRGFNVVWFFCNVNAAVSRAKAGASGRLRGRFLRHALVERAANGAFKGRFLRVLCEELRVAIF